MNGLARRVYDARAGGPRGEAPSRRGARGLTLAPDESLETARGGVRPETRPETIALERREIWGQTAQSWSWWRCALSGSENEGPAELER